jgi:hypothetical protein
MPPKRRRIENGAGFIEEWNKWLPADEDSDFDKSVRANLKRDPNYYKTHPVNVITKPIQWMGDVISNSIPSVGQISGAAKQLTGAAPYIKSALPLLDLYSPGLGAAAASIFNVGEKVAKSVNSFSNAKNPKQVVEALNTLRPAIEHIYPNAKNYKLPFLDKQFEGKNKTKQKIIKKNKSKSEKKDKKPKIAKKKVKTKSEKKDAKPKIVKKKSKKQIESEKFENQLHAMSDDEWKKIFAAHDKQKTSSKKRPRSS